MSEAKDDWHRDEVIRRWQEMGFSSEQAEQYAEGVPAGGFETLLELMQVTERMKDYVQRRN